MNPLVKTLFHHAAIQPDHPAVVTQNESVTYAEFATLVQRMAATFLPYLKTSDNPCVAIALPQGARAYAAMYATLYAGGFYVPLNLLSPSKKLARVMGMVKPPICIAESKNLDYVDADTVVLTYDDLSPEPRSSSSALNAIPDAHHLAYVIFTSGSTGLPKGVMIPQSALINYVDWVLQAFQATPHDRWSQHPNLAFDVSVTDIYGALSTGATLYPLIDEFSRLMPGDWIAENQITIWNSVPSVVDLMAKAKQIDHERLQSVRLFNFLGEPLLKEHVRLLFEAVPNTIVQNTYGPTEATVSCTAIQLNQHNWNSNEKHSIALGSAIPGMQTHIIDEELVLSGEQLADGYWQDAEKTENAFHTFLNDDGQAIRGYFTGDIVTLFDTGFDTGSATGDIYFVARKDHQVKIHGYRIELDEVLTAIKTVGYPECAITIHEQELYAFIEDTQVNPDQLRVRLSNYLEAQAIPKHIIPVDALVRNANDKVDAKAMLNHYLNISGA